MSSGNIQSNTVDAQEAIAELTGIDASNFQNQNIELNYSSGISGMETGKNLANQMLTAVSDLVSATLGQANKFPELAYHIEQRDQADARGWE
ncbi:MAG: TIGR04197 family type VII secretion effector [Streptococcaceae bacterium]|jgi:1-aminocyclopropane-1-carboxylate deaminase/D-cysteine desulfhydrase-like pyridoxal-dependent ACC family enzyme|nr:TIGR04197 family type VII secretion effector [Streptococcaceae bacterium]